MAIRPPKKKSKTIKPPVGMPGLINKFIKSLGLTAAQQLKLKKEMKQAGGMKSSDALKATASMIKSQKTQSKGPAGKVIKKKNGGKVARPEDVFIIGPDGKRKRKPVGDPRLRASDVFIMGPDGKRKRKPAVPKKRQRMKSR
jgi:hypothetical protein